MRAFQYDRDHNVGPYGLSYADDNWELRKAVKIRFVPRNEDHPYSYKDLYLDRETLTALYSFANDRKGEPRHAAEHEEAPTAEIQASRWGLGAALMLPQKVKWVLKRSFNAHDHPPFARSSCVLAKAGSPVATLLMAPMIRV